MALKKLQPAASWTEKKAEESTPQKIMNNFKHARGNSKHGFRGDLNYELHGNKTIDYVIGNSESFLNKTQ